MKERKIGEIFEHNGEWYQCVKSPDGSCKHCDMNFEGKCPIPIKECTESGRNDKSDVIFKRLEKVGEPYMLEDKKFQKYRVFKTPYIYHKIDCSWQSFSDPYYISLEIKKDMEEKKLNLKPFDIQKAREGKPVCTRDGRKARIICFDFQSIENTPIVAVVQVTDKQEVIANYYEDGRRFVDGISELDLIMLPEKRKGWINIHQYDVYKTKEEAEAKVSDKANYLTTIEIEY